MNPDLVEAVARAIFATQGWHGKYDWSEFAQEKSIAAAKVALKAHEEWLESQGLVVVPREPTGEMEYAGIQTTSRKLFRCDSVWKAMVTAFEKERKQPPETPQSPAESETYVQNQS